MFGTFLFIDLSIFKVSSDMIDKRTDVHRLIIKAWEQDKIRLSFHGKLRSKQREIGIMEIRDVILYGERDVDADSNKDTHWIYALRNKNVDGQDIRILFDLESYPDVIIVTLMHVVP